MYVIGYDYITTNPDVKFLRASKCIFSKRLMRKVQTINFASMESTYCDKKTRRIVGLENLLQPRWALFDHRTSLGAAASVAIPDLRRQTSFVALAAGTAAATPESLCAGATCLRCADGSTDLATKPAQERNHPA